MQLFDLISNQIKKMYVANDLGALYFKSIEYYINLNLLRDGSFSFLCELVDYLIKNKKRHLIRCLILGFNPEKLKSDDLFTKCLDHNLLTPLIYMALFSSDQFVLEPLLFLKKYILDNKIVKNGSFNFQKVKVVNSIGTDLKAFNRGYTPKTLFDSNKHIQKFKSSVKSLSNKSNEFENNSPEKRKFKSKFYKTFSNTVKPMINTAKSAENQILTLHKSQSRLLNNDLEYSEVEESDRVEMIFTWYVYSFSQGCILGQNIKRFNDFFLIFIDHLFQNDMINLLFSIDWKTSLLIYEACIHSQRKNQFFIINWNHYSSLFANSRKKFNSAMNHSVLSKYDFRDDMLQNEFTKSENFPEKTTKNEELNIINSSLKEMKKDSWKADQRTSIHDDNQKEELVETEDNPLDINSVKKFHSRQGSIAIQMNDINDETMKNLIPDEEPKSIKKADVPFKMKYSKTQESKKYVDEGSQILTEKKIKKQVSQTEELKLSSISKNESNELNSAELKNLNYQKVRMVNKMIEDKEKYTYLSNVHSTTQIFSDLINKTSVHFVQLLQHFSSNLMFIPDLEYFEFIIMYMAGIFINSQCLYFNESEYLNLLDSLLELFIKFIDQKEFLLKEAISLFSNIIQKNFEIINIQKVT
jgi:hypothetical protein